MQGGDWMDLKELIVKINGAIDELDLVSARKYIEENLELLQSKRSLLKGNARDLLTFLTDRAQDGYEPLTRTDMATINAINTYASKFEVRSLKITLKGKEHLLLRKDVLHYLNKDAIALLQGMRAL